MSFLLQGGDQTHPPLEEMQSGIAGSLPPQREVSAQAIAASPNAQVCVWLLQQSLFSSVSDATYACIACRVQCALGSCARFIHNVQPRLDFSCGSADIDQIPESVIMLTAGPLPLSSKAATTVLLSCDPCMPDCRVASVIHHSTLEGRMHSWWWSWQSSLLCPVSSTALPVPALHHQLDLLLIH